MTSDDEVQAGLTIPERAALMAAQMPWAPDGALVAAVEVIVARRVDQASDKGWAEGYNHAKVESLRLRQVYHDEAPKDGASLYLDVLESTHPSPRVQAIIDDLRAKS